MPFDRRLGNTQDRFLNEQNHLSYQTLRLRKCLVVLMLLKTRKLVSKFENPTPGAESPFSQQREICLDNLGRSSTCSSLLAVECTAMVFNSLQINSYVFSEEIGANAKKSVWLTKGRHTVIGSCGVRTQRRSHHHHTGHPVETSGCGHATFGFRSAPATSMNVVAHIGKQRLYKPRDCHQILTSSRIKRRPAVMSQ